jgi:nucleotide-binding universal stress UspA family protein
MNRAAEVQKKIGIGPEAQAIQVQGEVVVGHPAEEILRCVDEKKVDFMVVATHGRSGIRRWVMGSVADKVLHASKVPVLLVRAEVPEDIVNEKWPSRTFLVPLDGSALAEAVLPHVEAIAKQRGSELVDVVLLRVHESLEHVAYTKQVVDEYLAEVSERLRQAGLEVSSEVLEGNPSEEIIQYASRNPFNLIFMATHGRSGISRWALGSVAQTGVSSPIFLVRPPSMADEPLVPPLVSAIRNLPPV